MSDIMSAQFAEPVPSGGSAVTLTMATLMAWRPLGVRALIV